jgi:Carboxypeptidase regulatory-like domain
MGSRPSRTPELAYGVAYLLVAVVVVIGLALPLWVSAQDGSSALNGVVEDITGARVPAAIITIANPANGFRRDTTADAAGNFSFGILPPGSYDVSASAPGMTIPKAAAVELHCTSCCPINIRHSCG